MGGLPFSSPVPFSPPINATVAEPVRPCVSSCAFVSELIGALELVTSISATTWLALPATKPSFVTSPTLRPLKSTSAPSERPETEPSKTI